MRLDQSNFIKACRGTNEGTIPIWIMRQAGRYLPEYRALRSEHSFNEMCGTPELIEEVVWQPIDRFGLDAAILFSDILTMLGPLGMKFDFPKGGPQTEQPVINPEDVDRLTDYDVEKELSFVFEGIRRIKKRLPETPVIGFVGSPYTLACYMIKGEAAKGPDGVKKFMQQHPEAAKKLFDLTSSLAARYLQAQIDAGVDAVQVFLSWDGVLSPADFQQWSAAYIERIFTPLKQSGVPRIMFVNNLAPYLDFVRQIDCEVVGVDYRMSLAKAAAALPDKAVQGNLDPTVLFGGPEKVRRETKAILDSVDDHNRLIFNLGHGILQKTPLDSVQALVDTVHAYRS